MMSTCTSALLVVVLHGLADGVVDDKPHVGLVDAHAECHRGHDHLGDTSETVLDGSALSATGKPTSRRQTWPDGPE